LRLKKTKKKIESLLFQTKCGLFSEVEEKKSSIENDIFGSVIALEQGEQSLKNKINSENNRK
jgi:hypothetical protein